MDEFLTKGSIKMSDITPITPPTPIDWDTKKVAAEQQIEELNTLLAPDSADLHLYLNALNEVCTETNEERKPIADYWKAYLDDKSAEKLKSFFLE